VTYAHWLALYGPDEDEERGDMATKKKTTTPKIRRSCGSCKSRALHLQGMFLRCKSCGASWTPDANETKFYEAKRALAEAKKAARVLAKRTKNARALVASAAAGDLEKLKAAEMALAAAEAPTPPVNAGVLAGLEATGLQFLEMGKKATGGTAVNAASTFLVHAAKNYVFKGHWPEFFDSELGKPIAELIVPGMMLALANSYKASVPGAAIIANIAQIACQGTIQRSTDALGSFFVDGVTTMMQLGAGGIPPELLTAGKAA
jgi:hypothetical protein